MLSNKYLFQVLQYAFVILFLTSSIGKLLDNRGFSEVIQTYQLVPDVVTLALGLGLSLFELFLGLAILFNKRLLICGQLCIIVHIGFLTLAITTLWRGLEIPNCGCFGVFWARPMTFQTVIEDTVLLILSILFYFSVKKQKELL